MKLFRRTSPVDAQGEAAGRLRAMQSPAFVWLATALEKLVPVDAGFGRFGDGDDRPLLRGQPASNPTPPKR